MPEFRADIVSFAEALADRGIVAAIPHYFERTGTEAGVDATLATDDDLAKWKATCGDALAFLRDHASVNAGRLGVIGFSLRFVKYPGQGHRFTGPDLVAARKTTVDFLDVTL